MTDRKIIHAKNMAEAKSKLGEIFEKPDTTVEITQQVVKGSSEENERLKYIGEMLLPEGAEYVGSFATHIYRHNKLDGSFSNEIRTQDCFAAHTIRDEVSFALYAQSNAIAKKYGFQPNAAQRKTIKEK